MATRANRVAYSIIALLPAITQLALRADVSGWFIIAAALIITVVWQKKMLIILEYISLFILYALQFGLIFSFHSVVSLLAGVGLLIMAGLCKRSVHYFLFGLGALITLGSLFENGYIGMYVLPLAILIPITHKGAGS